MKQLIEFIPLVLFFLFFKFYDIYTAVAVLMASSTVAVIVLFAIYRKIEQIALFTYAMVMIFGALTLYFHNEMFIKWKVTVIYVVLACILLFSQLFLKKLLIKNLLGKELQLSDTHWIKVNYAWVIFFLFCGILNVFIILNFSDNVWVNFKSFGLIGLTLLFTLGNGLYIYKHAENNESNLKLDKK